jgi:hypothetical protein
MAGLGAESAVFGTPSRFGVYYGAKLHLVAQKYSADPMRTGQQKKDVTLFIQSYQLGCFFNRDIVAVHNPVGDLHDEIDTAIHVLRSPLAEDKMVRDYHRAESNGKNLIKHFDRFPVME